MQSFRLNSLRSSAVLTCVPLALILAAPPAHAEGYLGGSIGRAALEIDAGLFDESDSAFKVFGGYVVDLPAVDFSVEGGYVDFGNPSSGNQEVDATGLDAFAVVGADFGIVGVFAKAGILSWDADLRDGIFETSDDGTDSAYGIGLRFNVASLFVRAEYEKFDIESADVDLFSAGLVWRF